MSGISNLALGHFPDLAKISQKFFLTIFQLINPKIFCFIQGIKHPFQHFNPKGKGRFPGGEIVRQEGPKQGIRGVSANLLD
jgi:hypothetical protein